jgi:GntR family transcriptional regulator, transcriptional repressor for pyruvate dehydrogenase complex
MQIHKLGSDGNDLQLTRETLPEQVARHLLRHITDEKMQPGDLLPSVASLAAEFGVSRTVIREALKSVSAIGVIGIVKGKGALVKKVDNDLLRIFFQRTLQTDPNSLLALMEVRKPLEMQGAALAALNCTAEDIKKMEEVVAGLRESINDPDGYTTLDTEYHECISRASQNQILYSLISSIRNAVKESMIALRAKREAQGRLGEEQRSHEAILHAIRSRNPEAARTAMETHLNETLLLISESKLPAA